VHKASAWCLNVYIYNICVCAYVEISVGEVCVCIYMHILYICMHDNYFSYLFNHPF